MSRGVYICGGGMNKTVKLITAITGLLIAIGTLVGAITVHWVRIRRMVVAIRILRLFWIRQKSMNSLLTITQGEI